MTPTEFEEKFIEDLFNTCKTPFEFVEELLNNKFTEAETIESFSAYYTSEMVAESFIKEIQKPKSELLTTLAEALKP